MKLILFNFESNKNSQALAFALDWINEIAKHVEKLYVISLRCGDFEVKDNVEVYCVHQNKKNKIQTIFTIWKLLYEIHKKDNINGYFVHMAHYFVPIIYPFAKFFKQKIVLWYAHKSTPFSLRLAIILSDKIFSVSNASMRIKTKKFEPIGHGIDTTNRFKLKKCFNTNIKNIVTVGRISKIKNTVDIVKAFLSLDKNNLYLYIVGDAIGEKDKKYLQEIKKIIPKDKEKNIIFTSNIPFNKIIEIYNNMDLAVHLSDTGSLDKTILEPMAMGIPIVTSNDSAKELFSHLDGKGVFLLNKKSDLKKVLENILGRELDFDRKKLRKEVIKNHSLDKLAKRIIKEFK